MRDRFRVQPIDTNWPRDVLDALLAPILERVWELVPDLIADHSADADPAGFCQRLQTRRNIHAVTEDVLLLSDHVADVDADAKLGAPVIWHFPFAVDHLALD